MATWATDIFGRYGGEEFLLVLPECSADEARTVAEKIRAGVEGGTYPEGIRVTISGGGAVLGVETLDQLLEAADACLYAAKRGGRNRVEFRRG